MHCVGSLPSRVPSWGRAAGLGTLPPNPPSPRPVPDGAQQHGGAERAALRWSGQRAPGHRHPPGQPRSSRCDPRPGGPRSPLLPPPQSAADPGWFPRRGGAAALRVPLGTSPPVGAHPGGGNSLPQNARIWKKKIPHQKNTLKTKPQALPSAMFPPSSSTPCSPIFCGLPRATPIPWAEGGPDGTASCPTESSRSQPGSQCLSPLPERLARLWGAACAAPPRGAKGQVPGSPAPVTRTGQGGPSLQTRKLGQLQS